jgi:hypothetical protein
MAFDRPDAKVNDLISRVGVSRKRHLDETFFK